MATPTPAVRAKDFTPLRDNIFCTHLEGRIQKTKGGIIIPDDNMKAHGIKARWCRVWRVGPDVTAVVPGQWVYVEHGRWTNRIELQLPEGQVDTWKIDPAAILLVSDDEEKPGDNIAHSF
jgi:hypothetical protein